MEHLQFGRVICSKMGSPSSQCPNFHSEFFSSMINIDQLHKFLIVSVCQTYMQLSSLCNCFYQTPNKPVPRSPDKFISLTKIKEKVQKRRNRETSIPENQKKSLRKEIKNSLSAKKSLYGSLKINQFQSTLKVFNQSEIEANGEQKCVIKNPKSKVLFHSPSCFVHHFISKSNINQKNLKIQWGPNKHQPPHQKNFILDQDKVFASHYEPQIDHTYLSKQKYASTLHTTANLHSAFTSPNCSRNSQKKPIPINGILIKNDSKAKPSSHMVGYRSEQLLGSKLHNKSCLMNTVPVCHKNKLQDMCFIKAESVLDEESENFSEVIYQNRWVQENKSAQTFEFRLQKCVVVERAEEENPQGLQGLKQVQSQIFKENNLIL